MKRKFAVIIAMGCLGWLLIGSCRHELPFKPATGGGGRQGGGSSGPGPADTGSCSADTVYFAQTVLPLLTSNCAQSGCHPGVFNTYQGIRQYVSPGNANGSDLIDIVTSGEMPPGTRTPLNATQIGELTTWINQGAQNNGCVGGCDTSQVTYSGSIVPILTTNCTGCHSGSAPGGGGIDLTSYGNVIAQVNSGKLWGDVNHFSGFHAMPLGGAMLSTCDLSKINIWIKAGTPQN